MSTKQEIISDAAFKAWPFSFDFNFACKDGSITAATCKYYCPLAVNPTITNCCKELLLNVAEFLIHLWKRHHAWKLVQFCMKTSLFPCYLKCHLYRKSLCFSLLLFTIWWSIFDQSIRRLLPLSCFYGSSWWLFKVKISKKRKFCWKVKSDSAMYVPDNFVIAVFYW